MLAFVQCFFFLCFVTFCVHTENMNMEKNEGYNHVLA